MDAGIGGTAAPQDALARTTPLASLGDGRYHGAIARDFWIVHGPNGGYLAAYALKALRCEIDDVQRQPRSLTLHYLARPSEGPVEIDCRIERAGRSLTTATVRFTQDGRPVLLGIGAFSLPRVTPSFDDAVMPDVAGPDDCAAPLASPDAQSAALPMHHRYDMRWAIGDVADLAAMATRPALIDGAECGGWIRLAEAPGRAVDAELCAAFTDAFPPAVFFRGGEVPFGGVPTIDLTIHFRTSLPLEAATPADWTFARFRTRTAREGFVEEDGEIWSADGRLLAQSRQLALLI